MTLTRFFYINRQGVKVFCYNKFCTYPKKTKEYKELKNISKIDDYIIGIGYEYNTTNGTPITYKKFK